MIKTIPGYQKSLNTARLSCRRIYVKFKTVFYETHGCKYWVVAPGVKHNDGIVWIVFQTQPDYNQYYEIMKSHRYTAKICTLCVNYMTFQKEMWKL